MKTGTADLPLHGGKAPPWLWKRMRSLAGEIVSIIVYEHGPDEFLRRVSDPYWFQALSCVLGFDWHSSGTTTTTTAALKASISPELGIAIAGGKGATSRKAPGEIASFGEEMSLSTDRINRLIRSSRLSAKVDNSLLQDGYNLYHHTFFFTKDGCWAVVQQGMNDSYARRYHWLSEGLSSMIEEPHSAICSESRGGRVLDLTSADSRENRKASLDLVLDGPSHLRQYTAQRSLDDFGSYQNAPATEPRFVTGPRLKLPARHPILPVDLGKDGMSVLQLAYEIQPSSYEELISLSGMGPKRIRALALISEIIYGVSPSFKDPANYSFAHGGKDGYPYPVDRATYDKSISTLHDALESAKLGDSERLQAVRRLSDHMRSFGYR